MKAWNEWAEGNYVEPDMINGHAYLDVIRRTMLSEPAQIVASPMVKEET
jgi:hypothetical protein